MGHSPPSDHENGLLAQIGQGDNAPPLSITEISSALKRAVEDRFGHVRLRGEISGFKRAASGHVYLALKDDKAVIDGVIWRGNAGRLGFAAEDGLEVIATGKITTYAGRSKYQIVIDHMELAGEGALMQLFEKLKGRLQAEGLFDPARKKRLPFLPRTIGVVTSPTGSVIRDILHRLADRFPSHVLVWPVLVQGQGAAQQVADAIHGFNALNDSQQAGLPRPDLLIVARGGGSIEDLWGFNEEVVVRAIANSTIPVISAVGHETDTTLADFAADQRAPTPTAAAEMAVPVRAELQATVQDLAARSGKAIRRMVRDADERLEQRARRMPRADMVLASAEQRLDDRSERLARSLELRLVKAGAALDRVTGRLRPSLIERHISLSEKALARMPLDIAVLQRAAAQAEARLAQSARMLSQVHPDRPLALGFARVSDGKGSVISNRDMASAQPHLMLHFADGDLPVSPQDSDRTESPASGAQPLPESATARKRRSRKKGAGVSPDQPKLL